VYVKFLKDSTFKLGKNMLYCIIVVLVNVLCILYYTYIQYSNIAYSIQLNMVHFNQF